MRIRIGLSILAVSLMIFLAPALSPGQGGIRMKMGGGGGGGDPNKLFDFLAKGRTFFTIADTKPDGILRGPLTEFLKEKGLNVNGQITREQFADFNKQAQSKLSPGTGAPAAPGTPINLSPAPAPAMNMDAVIGWAEAEFRTRDRNGDNMLNKDEMSQNLRGEYERWDSNRDSQISLDEYKVFFIARVQRGARGDRDEGAGASVTVIIEEDELDKRPTVLRAGKLPKEGLPGWFMDLDIDKDAQVAFHEWRKGGKDLDEFSTWDRDDDGLITPQEAMRQHKVETKVASNGKTENGNGASASRGDDKKKGGGGGNAKWWERFMKK